MPAQKLADKYTLKTLNMEPVGIPPNVSQQHLMNEYDGVEAVGNVTDRPQREVKIQQSITLSQWVTVIVLCFVNLINYMDRYTVAGILDDIGDEWKLTDDMKGLLQTVFVISYMVFAPLFGYLGDRYNRRVIMAAGVFLWSLTTLVGSFMTDFLWFLAFRMLVGIGEASYSTIAPTIISDLFVQDLRSKMLALFYFAIPVGSGLGYIVGSEAAKLQGEWRWGLRVTPILGAIAVLLIIFALVEPQRGQSEGRAGMSHSSWVADIVCLCKNKSFILSTLGFTCVAFVTGALSWWGPLFIQKGLILQGQSKSAVADVSYKFGVITMISGIVGVPLGAMIAQKLRVTMPRADPIICATGLIVSAPLLFGASILASKSSVACFVLIFIGEVALNLNWSIVADILLYVVSPTRRSSAEAFQILISHAFGDAGSPYLIGLISEALKPVIQSSAALAMLTVRLSTLGVTDDPGDPEVEFKSLQYSLFITCFIEVLGGVFFLLTALYIVQDKAEAERQVSGVDNPGAPTHIYADDPLSRSEVNLTTA